MSIQILDPTHENDFAEFSLAKRLPTLEGAVVGVISNGKEGTKAFFDAFEHELIHTHGVKQVVQRVKSNYSAPADPHLLEEVKEWDALVAGIGD